MNCIFFDFYSTVFAYSYSIFGLSVFEVVTFAWMGA